MHRLFQISLSILLLATVAGAQAPEQSWDNLRSLGVGEKIQVVDQKLKSLKGTFVGFSDEAISFQVDQDEVSIPRPDVLRVTSLERTRRGRNAAIGFAIGAGLAVAMVLGVEDGPPPAMLPVGMAYLGAMGAGVGAIFPSHRTIYRAERRKDQTAP